MNRYQKIKVPLSLLDGDEEVIHYAGMVSRLAESAEVEFVHMVETPEIPGSVKEKYPWLLEPLDDMLLKKMEGLVREKWDGHEKTELKFVVQQRENLVMSILAGILEQDSDLVIVGRESFGGDLAVRLARKASCSVMSVPAGYKEELARIIVPTDFSEYSSQALDVGLAFGEAAGLAFIESVHVYNIGKYSHRITLPQDEIKDMAQMFAEDKHEEYLQTIDHRGVHVKMNNQFHPVMSNGILRAIRDLDSDLVVTGCRGRDTVTSWLLGGNAEYLLKNSQVPVVAVKPKGTGQKLLEALLQE
ncbi:MAG: universal stress protein [Puniceicoccaceae bacterium]